ncbi:MAG TPA: chloramphenicol acetyltransferase [Flavisolibacter sp.]|jgi:chloramphenicol O-acetyltransferase type A|nr:chloramphenicol acetyltransferase [Flavisolibacter sp.]
MKKLFLDTWHRRDHFNLFRQFEEPFFGVCIRVDCTQAYAFSKASGHSFFLSYLYASLKAANHTEPFRYRISGDEVIIHDKVHASPTINRPDGSFGFAYMDYEEDPAVFFRKAAAEVDRVRNSVGLVPALSGENVIHYSSLPWLDFTSLSHARAFSFKDCIPKISFGKMTENGSKKEMPVSIHVHHALMDGFHVGQYVDRFQEELYSLS